MPRAGRLILCAKACDGLAYVFIGRNGPAISGALISTLATKSPRGVEGVKTPEVNNEPIVAMVATNKLTSPRLKGG